MDDLYVKDSAGNYIPVSLEVASARDLADKLILVTLGNDDQPATDEFLDYFHKQLMHSTLIIDTMKRSKDTNLLILPHIIRFELISRRDLDAKTVCVRIQKDEDIKNLPELKQQIQDTIGKEVVVLPAPLSLAEYKEIKAIKERVRIRKQRSGGGLNTSKK